MALPRRLKSFMLFNEGNAYLGEVPELVLPKLAIDTEDYRAGGMPGKLKLDNGLQAMTLEWTAAGYLADSLRQFGTTSINGNLLRFQGALQQDDTGEVTTLSIVMRGRHSQIDFGTAKAGDATQIKHTTELSYYKLTLANVDQVEIDVVNSVYIVGGVDRMAEIRTALGII